MADQKRYFVDGARLSSARIKRGLSLDEAGKIMKRNKGTISKWERGLDRPSLEAVEQMRLLYGVDDFVIWVGKEAVS